MYETETKYSICKITQKCCIQSAFIKHVYHSVPKCWCEAKMQLLFLLKENKIVDYCGREIICLHSPWQAGQLTSWHIGAEHGMWSWITVKGLLKNNDCNTCFKTQGYCYWVYDSDVIPKGFLFLLFSF